MKRECGPCSACCTSLGVPEIHKAQGQKCQQVKTGGGCEIYSRRPRACRDYQCEWLKGRFLLADDERPDLLGVSFDKTDGHRPDIYPDGYALIAREAVPGGFDLARHFLVKLSEQYVIVLVAPGERRTVLGPAEKIEKVRQAMRRFLPVARGEAL
jgi:hypothetical protein